MTVILVLEAAVIVVLAILVAGLLRGYAELLRTVHGLERGQSADQAPPFVTAPSVPGPSTHDIEGRREWRMAHDLGGRGLDGSVAYLRVVGVSHDTMLAFLSSGCTGCARFWEETKDPRGWGLPAGTRLVVVTKDAQEESPAQLALLAEPGSEVVMSSQAWDEYAVPGSPYVVVVDGPSGRVKGEGSGMSFGQLNSLVRAAVGDQEHVLRRKPASDATREAEVDRILLESGIGPGHPSLHGHPSLPPHPTPPEHHAAHDGEKRHDGLA